MMTTDNEILAEIKRLVKQNAPDAQVILFGSRARGDARPDSDWDVLILLDRDKFSSADYDKIAYPLFDLAMTFDAFVSPKIYTKNDWLKRSCSIFYKNVEEDGVELS
jgi:predicted nucleotidyltransferase